MFGKFLELMLERFEVGQSELAKRSKTKQGNISRTIRGQMGYQNPTLRLAKRYAQGFRMSLANFIDCYEYFLDHNKLPDTIRKYKKKREQKEELIWRRSRKL